MKCRCTVKNLAIVIDGLHHAKFLEIKTDGPAPVRKAALAGSAST